MRLDPNTIPYAPSRTRGEAAVNGWWMETGRHFLNLPVPEVLVANIAALVDAEVSMAHNETREQIGLMLSEREGGVIDETLIDLVLRRQKNTQPIVGVTEDEVQRR